MRAVLAKREQQLQQFQRQLANSVKKMDMAEVAQRAATWEEDNARLNQVLAQTKQMLGEAEKRAQRFGRNRHGSKNTNGQISGRSQALGRPIA